MIYACKITFETFCSRILRQKFSCVLNLHSIPLFTTKGAVFGSKTQRERLFLLEKISFPTMFYGVFETNIENYLLKGNVATYRKMIKSLLIHKLCAVGSDYCLLLTMALMQAVKLVD